MAINTGPSASYVIPFRMGDSVRLQNLQAVIEWVSKMDELEIIVVEQDEQPSFENIQSEGVNYVYQHATGLFNKSRAINEGAKHATSNVLVLADADMILDHTALDLCIQACSDHVDAVNPYTHLVDLSEQERLSFIQSRALPTKEALTLSDRQKEGEVLCFCGGIYLMKKQVFQDVGGMDEAFQGWGGEDDAMSIKLNTLNISQLIKHSQLAYHLWHQRDLNDRYQHVNYQANLSLLKRYARMSESELRDYCDR